MNSSTPVGSLKSRSSVIFPDRFGNGRWCGALTPQRRFRAISTARRDPPVMRIAPASESLDGSPAF
eukprot:1251247-Pyramimonas_sp.AAC.1